MWKFVLGLLVFVIIATFTVVGADHDKLGICGPTTTSGDSSSSLVFVTTLDGKISALDLANNGEKKWTIEFSEGALLSSSIYHYKLNKNEQWLIPSLSGGLYKFDGKKIESVPLTADQLFHMYFHSEDLVFPGGKEICYYGISLKTGKVIYQCNSTGCTNKTDGDSYIEQENILIIKRHQQTVRAIKPHKGQAQEQWFYSVGQHELILTPQQNQNCNDNSINNKYSDIELKADVPRRTIWAISKNNPTLTLWSHEFDTPIVSIWRENIMINNDSKNKLEQINLFESRQWSWDVEFSVSPRIYIGMHNHQLYIQENKNNDVSFELPQSKSKNIYPWQRYPAKETAIALINENNDKNVDNGLSNSNYESQAIALSVPYNFEFIDGNGLYLFGDYQVENSSKFHDTNTEINEKSDEIDGNNGNNKTYESNLKSSFTIIMSSFWYWWREITIVSISTAFLLNYIITQRILNASTRTNDVVVPPIIVERHFETKATDDETIKISIGDSINEFKSRYLSDFMPINCLGKGGYGVVFEAKNKIDDCSYAIKRIALPNSKDSRERVMREVKALAKLDHHNIVRYFHAWLECPPAGWKEEHDQIYINKQLLTPSQCPTTDDITTNTKDNNNINFVSINVPLNERSSVDSAIEAVELNCPNDDDSFIIFDSSHSGESEMTEEYDDDLSSKDNSSQSNINNNSRNNYDCDEDSMSIVFKNSTSNSINKSYDNSIMKQNEKSMIFNSYEKKKPDNKKSPKMFLYIQMQLCQRLSLREWLKRESSRDYSRIVNIFQQIVDAVEYVHLQGLIHRDLKPSNVFFAYDDKVKIGDFGLVTAIPEGCNGHKPCIPSENDSYISSSDLIISQNCNHTACVGTKLYMSPEQMNEQVYDYKVDIYSLGIILFELLMPFNTEMERIMALMDLRKSIFPEEFPVKHPNEYNLLKMMLDDDPNKRPTTLGMKARPPLSNCATIDKSTNDDGKWHFELPQISRQSLANSISGSSSSSNSWNTNNLI